MFITYKIYITMFLKFVKINTSFLKTKPGFVFKVSQFSPLNYGFVRVNYGLCTWYLKPALLKTRFLTRDPRLLEFSAKNVFGSLGTSI